MVFEPIDVGETSVRYLKHLLNGAEFARKLQAVATGTTNSHVRVRPTETLRWDVLLPRLEEQRRIAEILDTIDETIQATERVIAKLRAAWTGAIDEMLRPGRTPDDAPPSWMRGIVGDFLHLQRGFDITKDAQRSGVVPVVSSSGIASYHDEAKVKGPGVVTGRKGKLGEAYFIPVDFWPHDTSLWVTDFKGNDPKFVALFLQSLRLQRLDAATSVPTLNRNVVHPLKAAIPSLAEQQQIVGVNDEYEDRVQTERRVLKQLTAVRAGLAADLLSGRVRTVAA